MKNKSLSFICLLFATNCFSQVDSINAYSEPEFIGGRRAFYSYLNKYLNCPTSEIEKGLTEANLTATIYITKEGRIKFVNVAGQNIEFKNQSKRVLTLMPDWTIAKFHGTPIDTFVIQRIFLSIDNSRIKNDTTIYEYIYSQRPMTEEEYSERKKGIAKNTEKYKTANNQYDEAVAEFNKNNYSKAIELFNSSKQNGLEKIDLYFNLGLAHLKSGDHQNACVNFLEAARKGDQEAFILYLKMCK